MPVIRFVLFDFTNGWVESGSYSIGLSAIVCLVDLLLTILNTHKHIGSALEAGLVATYRSALGMGLALQVVGYLISSAPLSAVVPGTLLIFLLWSWWRQYKKRIKKIGKALGAKSKALRDKLVKRLKELKPRPVRIPIPTPN